MPSWMADLLKVLGLSTPAIYAAGTYGLFHWLDEKSSDEAKSTISKLLQPKDYDPFAISATLVEIFNRIYTPHLLSWSAFWRSALFTMCMFAIFLYEIYHGHKSNVDWSIVQMALGGDVQIVASLGFTAATNVISDYLSLFVVKHLLMTTKGKPLLALCAGPLSGISIVLLFNVVSNAALSLYLLILLRDEWSQGYLALLYENIRGNIVNPEWLGLSVSALIVHLWLPLFSISVGVLRLLNYLRQAVGWTQWFLKEGDRHPFEAIGYVAAIIVFLGTIIAIKL